MRNSKKMFNEIKKYIKDGYVDWNDLTTAPPNVRITHYDDNANGGSFYRGNNGYPQIEINTNRNNIETRHNAFTLIHEYGHYLSDVKGTRPVQLAGKREQTPDDISLKEVCILLEEEIRAWRLGFETFGKNYLDSLDKILYSIRALYSVCTSLVVFLNKRVVCTAWYWVINKPTNWVFEKIDM